MRIELRKDDRFWRASFTNDNTVVYEWGKVDGKIQRETREFKVGKNIGKKNETTPAEQCHFDVQRKAIAKKKDGFEFYEGNKDLFDETKIKSANARKDVFYDVPKCMLAKKYNDRKKNIAKWNRIGLQPKIDGTRCLCNIKTGKLYSRSRKLITSLPGLGKEIQKTCANLPNSIHWVDGELYSDDISFQEIISIINQKNNVHDDSNKISFRMYDLISILPFEDRYNLYKTCKSDRVRPLATIFLDNYDEKKIDDYHDAFVKDGWEGLMLRNAESSYEFKRSDNLIKFKKMEEDEFKLIGWKSERLRDDKMGSATLITKDDVIFSARPAMPDFIKEEIWKNKEDYIGCMATVQFQGYTDDGALRFPVLKGFRPKEDFS